MDIKNRGNFPDGLPFRNKTLGQFTLIQSKLSRPSKLDASLLGRLASRASTLSNQVAFKLRDACENGHDHFSCVRGSVSPRLGNRLESTAGLADCLHSFEQITR